MDKKKKPNYPFHQGSRSQPERMPCFPLSPQGLHFFSDL